jgi:hypothetical protein
MVLAEVHSIFIYRRSLAYDMPFKITTAAFNHLLPSSYTDTVCLTIRLSVVPCQESYPHYYNEASVSNCLSRRFECSSPFTRP